MKIRFAEFKVPSFTTLPTTNEDEMVVLAVLSGVKDSRSQAAYIMTAAPRLFKELENAGRAMLGTHTDRMEALRRIKNLYFYLTGFPFIVDPNQVEPEPDELPFFKRIKAIDTTRGLGDEQVILL